MTLEQERLITDNLPLARWWASKIRRSSGLARRLPDEDCLQAANLGLIRAARYFDPARGVKFATYASRAIYLAIMDASRAEAGMITVPRLRPGRRSPSVPIQRQVADFSLLNLPDKERPAGHQLEARELAARLMAAVPPGLPQEVIVLHCVEKVPLREVGNRLGIPYGQVRKLATFYRQKLKRMAE